MVIDFNSETDAVSYERQLSCALFLWLSAKFSISVLGGISVLSILNEYPSKSSVWVRPDAICFGPMKKIRDSFSLASLVASSGYDRE